MKFVLWKLALMLHLQHGLCVEEAEDVEEMLDDHGDSRRLASLYSDLTRMGGGRWSVGAEEAFDADNWIDRAVEAGADSSYGGLVWPEEKLAAADTFAFKDLTEVRKRRIREALKSRPRSSTIRYALRTYGDEGGVAWHGATELYDIVEVCRKRWDLRPVEEVMVRDGLIAAGYVDPLAMGATDSLCGWDRFIVPICLIPCDAARALDFASHDASRPVPMARSIRGWPPSRGLRLGPWRAQAR